MRRPRRLPLGMIGLVTLALLATPVTARAGRRHHQGHDHHHGAHHRHGHHVYHYGGPHRSFVAPPHIRGHYLRTYRPYYQKRAYYRPHRHYHSVYRFPVRTPYGRVSRSYAYCDGSLYHGHGNGLHVSVRTPHFGIAFHGH